MELYRQLENNTDDVYLGDGSAIIAWKKHKRPDQNVHMVNHIEEEKDIDRSKLIQIGVLKSTSENTINRLKIWQETRVSKNAKMTLGFYANKGKLQI